jgi:hypothetical protein
MTSAQDLLAFIVFREKSGLILIGLPLYVTWPFSLIDLKFFSLFWAFGVLTIIWQEKFVFLVQSIWSSEGFVYVYQ